jgi:integrase
MPHEKRSRASKIRQGSFAEVIRAFTAPDNLKWTKLGDATRENYGRVFRLAERPDVLGAIPVDEMRPALVQAFLDGYADRPAMQKVAQTALKSLEKWALVRDKLPCQITLGTEAPGSDGGNEPWTDEDVRLAEQHARPDLARMVTLAANTGQRGSDLVKMRWTDIEEYEGRLGINVVQRKTGLKIWLPMTQELEAAIGTWERRPGYLILKPDGTPYIREDLSNHWLRERNKNPALAPLRPLGLSMHGLRATAVVRLARAGASTRQIADMVGMSEPMVARYCRFSSQRKNALAAVHYLDRTPREHAIKKSSGNGS